MMGEYIDVMCSSIYCGALYVVLEVIMSYNSVKGRGEHTVYTVEKRVSL